MAADCQALGTRVFRESSYLVAQMVKNLPEMRETWVPSWGQEDPPGEGNGCPLQYSCLEKPMDRGVWRATIHGVYSPWGRKGWDTTLTSKESLSG